MGNWITSHSLSEVMLVSLFAGFTVGLPFALLEKAYGSIVTKTISFFACIGLIVYYSNQFIQYFGPVKGFDDPIYYKFLAGFMIIIGYIGCFIWNLVLWRNNDNIDYSQRHPFLQFFIDIYDSIRDNPYR